MDPIHYDKEWFLVFFKKPINVIENGTKTDGYQVITETKLYNILTGKFKTIKKEKLQEFCRNRQEEERKHKMLFGKRAFSKESNIESSRAYKQVNAPSTVFSSEEISQKEANFIGTDESIFKTVLNYVAAAFFVLIIIFEVIAKIMLFIFGLFIFLYSIVKGSGNLCGRKRDSFGSSE